MSKIRELIQALNWPELRFTPQTVRIPDFNITMLRTARGRTTLVFVYRRENDEGEVTIGHRYLKLKRIRADVGVEISEYVTRNLKLKSYSQIEEIFKINSNDVETIDISPDHDEYFRRRRTLFINPRFLQGVQKTVSGIYQKADGYSKTVFRHFFNEYLRSTFRRTIKRRTLVSKGEFSFLVKRYNLDTKNSEEDFRKYLNESDIHSLQVLCRKLIENEIFESGFIHGLNDYFIKERLEEIIKLGREILGLKSPRMDTLRASEVVSKVVPGEDVRQMETIWQRYFERYLLYLIFSYQGIYPKVELEIDLDKRFPDFIGINHYGGLDIIEIKTHLKNALIKDRSHQNYAFSSEMSKAIIQTINYMDALTQQKFHDLESGAEIVDSLIEGNIYRPRGIIIISSYGSLVKGVGQDTDEFENIKRDFTKLRNSLNNIQILTFDEIINMADKYANRIIRS
ncbi:MAG: DUF4263 domain-containing protein [Thermodesulfobacteriota bacterium]|nr:DUF4263 domain-containing protein [Thermodesulfobacteriota bacterium]